MLAWHCWRHIPSFEGSAVSVEGAILTASGAAPDGSTMEHSGTAYRATNTMARLGAAAGRLPWASLPLRVQDNAFRAMSQLMHDHSVFCTFAYLQGLVLPGAQALRAGLRKEFRSVTYSRIVWCNFPPAFVYICRR